MRYMEIIDKENNIDKYYRESRRTYFCAQCDTNIELGAMIEVLIHVLCAKSWVLRVSMKI